MKDINKIKLITVTGAVILSLGFSGCSMLANLVTRAPDLQANSESVKMYEKDSIDMMLIDVAGKTYAPYGIPGSTISNESLRECLGYVDDDKNTRIYSLSEDPYDNYLLIKNVNGFMDQPVIWRNFSTYGEDIFTPDYIESLEYEEWGSSGGYPEMKEFKIDVECDADDIRELMRDYKINGNDSGTGGVKNTDLSPFEKGEILNLGVPEYSLYEKFDMDEPFELEVVFVVTTTNGDTVEVDGGFEGTVKLGEGIQMTITGNAEEGYTIR